MPSGVIQGTVSGTTTRIPRATTTLPISTGQFLSGITIVGDTFSIDTLGNQQILLFLYPRGFQKDIPYRLQLFNVTQNVVIQEFDRDAPGNVVDSAAFMFAFAVTAITDFYSFRMVVENVDCFPDYALTLSNPAFRAIIQDLSAGSGSTDFKAPARVVDTLGLAIAAYIPGVVIDTVVMAAGNRILRAAGTDALNGIYDVTVAGGVRSSDFNSSAEAIPGCMVPVTEGTVGNADTIWELATNAPIVLGVTPLTFVRLAVAIDQLIQRTSLGTNYFAAAGTSAFQLAVTADVNARFEILADGSMSWGTGAAPADATLVRNSVGSLQFNKAPDCQPGTGTNNCFVGLGAGASIAGGTANSAFGVDSLRLLTTGINNTAVGWLAMETTGVAVNECVAVGVGALAAVTGSRLIGIGAGDALQDCSATDCIALGYAALSGVSGTITGAGNIGIGRETLLNLTSGTFNIAIGVSAIAGTIVTGSNNIAIGSNAILNGLTTGSNNIALGEQTLRNNTTGGSNVGIGKNSLVANLIGNSNIAIGEQTLAANLADANTAVGNFAMIDCTTGTANTAIGSSAGRNLTTANACIAIGQFAMGTSVVTGDQNIAIGYFSLTALTSGTLHVAIGSNSLAAMATADSCTGVGNSTLKAATGGFNTALGSRAGEAITTGTSNIAIGFAAAFTAPITGDYNILMGRECATAITSGADNIVMGHLAGAVITTGADNIVIGSGSNAGDSNSVIIGSNANAPAGFSFTGSVAIGFTAVASRDSIAIGYTANSINGGVSLGNNAGASQVAGAGVNILIGGGVGATITTATDNVAIGAGALSTISVGSHNVVVGSSAAASAAALSDSVIIGYNTANAITTAAGSTIVGFQACQALTTGNNNTAIGYLTLTTVDVGSDNTAVGTACMQFSTDSSSTAIGSSSLKNSTGSNNDAHGFNALLTNTTGATNSAFGYASLLSNTTGSSNCAFGAASMNLMDGANSNSAFGVSSFASLTTGNSNIGIGRDVASNLTTGSDNVIIGYGGTLVSGDTNVVIGSGADVAAAGTGACVAIGKNAKAATGEANILDKVLFDASNNVLINGLTTTVGTNGTFVICLASGVAPTTSPANEVQFYSNDFEGTAGQAAFHLRDETGFVTIIGDGFIYKNRTEDVTAGTGAPNVLLSSESGKVITNIGVAAIGASTLPTPAAGLTFTFICQDADGIRCNAAGGATIRLGASVTAANGRIDSTTIGSAVILVAISTTEWYATSIVGVWVTT